ncbi:MAG: hypothetical protein WCO94_11895 [Verrucomicrobiota bacterium]
MVFPFVVGTKKPGVVPGWSRAGLFVQAAAFTDAWLMVALRRGMILAGASQIRESESSTSRSFKTVIGTRKS